jgi:hypothetical protein
MASIKVLPVRPVRPKLAGLAVGATTFAGEQIAEWPASAHRAG